MHVLATFLGGGTNRQYRPARYRFDEGTYETPLFGWSLVHHFHTIGRPLEKLVVFGTSTSFWEHLLEVACPGHESIGVLAQLARSGISGRRQLQPYQSLVANAVRAFGVKEVRLELIDFLDTSDTQTAFIGQIADLLSPGDELSLDVTHGLRHQPILGTLAALVLRSSGHAGAVSGIYYGAIDLTPKIDGAETPVLRLDPLLGYADWIQALAKAEVSGDYGPLAERLRHEGVSAAACDALAEGSFFHAIGNYDAAATQFALWRRAIGSVALRGPAALFIHEVNARIDALTTGDQLSRLIEDARKAHARGALVRAAELGYEATQLVLAKQQMDNVGYRESFEKWERRKQRAALRDAPQFRWKRAFDRLKNMRNRMAHLDFESSQSQAVQRALASRSATAKALAEDFEVLFGSDLQQAMAL